MILGSFEKDTFLGLDPLPSAANSGGNNKKNNWQLSVLPINDFGQQRLNGTANDWSAAKGGQVLSHFEHIVSGASTPPCPITAVFKFL
jgi:hypothetical protein